MSRVAAALRLSDREREERLSVHMGREEGWRVDRACLAADQHQSVASAVEYAVARERGRCLAIAELWPDNLMAKEIAKRRIRAGAEHMEAIA